MASPSKCNEGGRASKTVSPGRISKLNTLLAKLEKAFRRIKKRRLGENRFSVKVHFVVQRSLSGGAFSCSAGRDVLKPKTNVIWGIWRHFNFGRGDSGHRVEDGELVVKDADPRNIGRMLKNHGNARGSRRHGLLRRDLAGEALK